MSLAEEKEKKIEIDDIEQYVWQSDGDYVRPVRWSELSPEERECFLEHAKEIAEKNGRDDNDGK